MPRFSGHRKLFRSYGEYVSHKTQDGLAGGFLTLWDRFFDPNKVLGRGQIELPFRQIVKPQAPPFTVLNFNRILTAPAAGTIWFQTPPLKAGRYQVQWNATITATTTTVGLVGVIGCFHLYGPARAAVPATGEFKQRFDPGASQSQAAMTPVVFEVRLDENNVLAVVQMVTGTSTTYQCYMNVSRLDIDEPAGAAVFIP